MLTTVQQRRFLDWISAVDELIRGKREGVRGNSASEWGKSPQWVRACAIMKSKVYQSAWVKLCCYNKPQNFSDLKQWKLISLICHMSIASYQDAPCHRPRMMEPSSGVLPVIIAEVKWNLSGNDSKNEMHNSDVTMSFMLPSYWLELVIGSIQHKGPGSTILSCTQKLGQNIWWID